MRLRFACVHFPLVVTRRCAPVPARRQRGIYSACNISNGMTRAKIPVTARYVPPATESSVFPAMTDFYCNDVFPMRVHSARWSGRMNPVSGIAIPAVNGGIKDESPMFLIIGRWL